MGITIECRHRLFIDLETFSSVNITKAGAFKYVESPDFEILLLAYARDSEPVQVIDLTDPFDLDELSVIVDMIVDPEVIKIAHNCAFERACLSKYLGRDMPPEEWEDTMIMAAMNGLPMSLDSAGAALNLKDQKIKEGTTLLKCDISNFFGSTPHDVAIAAIRKRVKDEWAAAEVERIIKSFNQGNNPDVGMGLGSQVTQLVELAVLDDLDHYAKEQLHIKHYIRYRQTMNAL